jgi:glycosyltransferase involved in cell wall biosynthesis
MRIAVWAGNYGYWGEFNPERLFRENGGQLGGGETAAVMTSLGLAAAGHQVIVGCQIARRKEYGFATFVPADLFVPTIYAVGADVIVSWDAPEIFRFQLPSKAKVIAYQLNDSNLGIFDYVIDAYFHPSQWHATRFSKVYGIPAGKQYPTITNGTDPAIWKAVERTGRGHRVIYCSSPDRGLHHLLRIWPAIRQAVPDSELHLYYDMDKWLGVVTEAQGKGFTLNTTERALEIQNNLRPLFSQGVVYHGGVSKVKLAQALVTSKVLAYPCDPVAPTEGFSMTILDGLAAGCNVLTSTADALPELWGEYATLLPLPIQDDIWIQGIIAALDRPNNEDFEVPYQYTWRGLANTWLELFTKLLMEDNNGKR